MKLSRDWMQLYLLRRLSVRVWNYFSVFRVCFIIRVWNLNVYKTTETSFILAVLVSREDYCQGTVTDRRRLVLGKPPSSPIHESERVSWERGDKAGLSAAVYQRNEVLRNSQLAGSVLRQCLTASPELKWSSSLGCVLPWNFPLSRVWARYVQQLTARWRHLCCCNSFVYACWISRPQSSFKPTVCHV
jgi:hypothetical protein